MIDALLILAVFLCGGGITLCALVIIEDRLDRDPDAARQAARDALLDVADEEVL